MSEKNNGHSLKLAGDIGSIKSFEELLCMLNICALVKDSSVEQPVNQALQPSSVYTKAYAIRTKPKENRKIVKLFFDHRADTGTVYITREGMEDLQKIFKRTWSLVIELDDEGKYIHH